MHTIHKFPVLMEDDFILDMPEHARVLSAQMQRGYVCMWILLDPQEARSPRRFRVVGTGHNVKDPGALSFISTFQTDEGLVFHLFEILD